MLLKHRLTALYVKAVPLAGATVYDPLMSSIREWGHHQ